MGEPGDLWDFGTIRRDIPRVGTVSRPGASAFSRQQQPATISRGSVRGMGSVRSATRLNHPSPNAEAEQFPSPPTGMSLSSAAGTNCTTMQNNPGQQQQHSEQGSEGYDTVRFAGDIAEQQRRVESGQWVDARGQEGLQYDSDEEERERPLARGEEDDELHYAQQQQQPPHEGHHEGDELDDSQAILVDVVVPVIESVSSLASRMQAQGSEVA